MPDLLMAGEWAKPTCADFSELISAIMAAPQIEPPTYWVMSDEIFHRLSTIQARMMWRESYRAARVLGNRQLAFDKIGNRRKGFANDP